MVNIYVNGFVRFLQLRVSVDYEYTMIKDKEGPS